MIFAVSFLGALFAILAALLIVYSYVTLILIPRIKRGFRAFIEKHGSAAMFEQAKIDPAEIMREVGVDVVVPREARARDVVVFTCEDHGRCAGCSRVLAQFEAIIRNQGSLDEVERKCYEQLRETLAASIAEEQLIGAWVVDQRVEDGVEPELARDAATRCKPTAGVYADQKDFAVAWSLATLDYCRKWRAWARLGVDEDRAAEGEVARQKQLADRLVEALVREGIAATAARAAVWSCTAAERATFASWIVAARDRLVKASSSSSSVQERQV